ncbi:Glutathione S-transferase A3 [Apodemus speciosus]|uniref:glutathione transferase n=2 Tax=Murinae TaxID=39107 RepID=A0ABQ0EDC3_APOSI
MRSLMRKTQAIAAMSGKPVLHYFDGRGRMEPIRWLLAAAGVEFEEKFLKTRDDLARLRSGEKQMEKFPTGFWWKLQAGSLMFEQVPMVEIDGMKLVQTKAILNYIASKYNLYGKDVKERALIDMYTEGVADLEIMILYYPYMPSGEKEASLASIKDKARNRYFPAYEKSAEEPWTRLPRWQQAEQADVYLVELLYHVEELDPGAVDNFPLLKALRTRVSNLPTVKKFLQPGSQRKPFDDAKCVESAKKIFS